jgi:hypothetical protein
MKDDAGKVIGFEKLSFVSDGDSPLHVGFEAVGA